MTSQSDRIAQIVLAEFDKLPAKRKPVVRDNGLHEWVPLSAIVQEQEGTLTCIALANEMPTASKIPACRGIVLHDCHAEILAIRTFNRHLLDECYNILRGIPSALVERKEGTSAVKQEQDTVRPFRIKDNVTLHMYCSEAPCGDASMELTMAAQEDATPWPETSPVSSEAVNSTLAGREGFSQLGIVRRKPGRRDAAPTLSKSCSDKLALKQCVSLLSSVSSLFIEAGNAYISKLIVPSSQYSPTGCKRSFSDQGRMGSLAGRSWSDGFRYRPFEVQITDVEFQYSRRVACESATKICPSNLSIIRSASGVEETLLGGVIQGRKSSDIKAASRISRRHLWLRAMEIAHELDEYHADIEQAQTYGDVKALRQLDERRMVIKDAQSQALSGWVKNSGDSDFHIYQ